METKKIVLDGRTAEGARIEMPGAPPLIFIRGEKGVIFCGYLSLEAAEKFDLAAVIVRGVKSIDEMLEEDVSLWTRKAAALGVMEGMNGKEALKLLL